MSVALLIQDDDAERLTFSVSALAELVAALHVLAEPGHHGGLIGWSEGVRAGLPPGLATEYAGFSFLWRSYRPAFFFPAAPGRVTDLAEGLAEVDALPAERFAEEALQSLRGGAGRDGLAGVLDRPAAQTRVRTYARARGPRVAAVVDAVLADPPAARARLRRFLEDCWEAFFATEWRRLRHVLVGDVQQKSALVRSKGVYAALQAISQAVHVDRARHRVVLDKVHHGTIDVAATGLALLPSALGWPHLVVQDDPSWPVCVTYPLARGRRQATTVRTVERRLEALAEPVRLRLCRSIAREGRSTQELADIWGMTPPGVSRHLKALRDAGLVSTHRHGHFVLYRLDLEAVQRLGTDLLDALLR